MGSLVVAFMNGRKLCSGDSSYVLSWLRTWRLNFLDGVVVFDETNGCVVELGNDVPVQPRGPGRPKLPYEHREVSLLPIDWAWLAAQPGGALAALRRVVAEARKASADDPARRDATYRFIRAMGMGLPGYEQALRLVFTSHEQLSRLIEPWPRDLRCYVEHLLQPGPATAETQEPGVITR